MADFGPPPPGKTGLAKRRILSPTAGIRVSPLQIGAMSFGTAWASFMGSVSEEQTFKLLDAFVENGGNFVDTANNYQNEESETFIGNWMAARKNRDQMVIATKYTTGYRSYADGKNETINSAGNAKKSLHLSVRDSLAKLQTDYIDILYLHWWDYTTTVEEVMDSLHILVQQGKVLYLGISDAPAWVVAACNTYAKQQGKTPFVAYQGQWNVLARDFERDILPMARHFGLALCPWDVIGGGRFKTEKQLAELHSEGKGLRAGWRPQTLTPDEEQASHVLSRVATEHGFESPSIIAIAYLMSKYPYVVPIVGGRKVDHLLDNINAIDIVLTPQQIVDIEAIKPVDLGFPTTLVGADPGLTGQAGAMLSGTGLIEVPPVQKPFGY